MIEPKKSRLLKSIADITAGYILTDENYKKDVIAGKYFGSDEETRKAIDGIFINLCGYSLGTIIKISNENHLRGSSVS